MSARCFDPTMRLPNPTQHTTLCRGSAGGACSSRPFHPAWLRLNTASCLLPFFWYACADIMTLALGCVHKRHPPTQRSPPPTKTLPFLWHLPSAHTLPQSSSQYIVSAAWPISSTPTPSRSLEPAQHGSAATCMTKASASLGATL